MSSNPGAGFEYPPTKVSWLKRDILLFANSIGCTADELHFLFESHPNFAMFPTYAVILPIKGDSQEVINFYDSLNKTTIPDVPKLDPARLVDGQRLMQFFRPLPPSSEGLNFELRTKVLGVYDKGNPGTVMEMQRDIIDKESGQVYVREIGSVFYVGQGNWGGPKGLATQNFKPPPGKSPDNIEIIQTSPETALLYRLNGDYNPLHATPEPGKKMGFGGTIIHGLYSWNAIAHSILKVIGGSKPQNLKEFQARFVNPVRPGDKLITEIWRMGEFKGEFEEIRFQTKIEGGKICLNNGRALIRPADTRESKI